MGTIKVFNLGGLDQKSNDLNRPSDKASDMLNMEFNTESSMKSRSGYDSVSIDGSTSVVYDDIIHFNYTNEDLCFTQNVSTVKIINKNTLTSKTVNLPSGFILSGPVSISSCENQNCLYLTNSTDNSYVVKYDGSNIYRSGLITPRVGDASGVDLYPSWTSPVAGVYTRIFYSHKDITGNVNFSPYVEYDTGTGVGIVLTIDSFKTDTNCKENGFLDKFCYRAIAGTQTINSAAPTMTVTRHNYVAGEKFLMDTENTLIGITPTGKTFLALDIASVTGTTITFTTASLGAYTITLSPTVAYSTEYAVDVRSKFHIATSTQKSFGYKITSFVLDNGSVTGAYNTINPEPVLYKSRPNTLIFEDVYDSTTLKVMPPICKFIASYGNQIIYGAIDSFFSTYSHNLNAPNQRISYSNDDLIIYSDVSTGDGPENTSELNRQKIGETYDGSIAGIKRANDTLIILKSRGVFSLDGTLIQGQYTLRKISTNNVGCTSHKSILATDDGIFFQGHNGIYFTNGIGVKKVTSEIDSSFVSGVYTTRSCQFKKKQKALFYVPELSKVVVIDYYYGQIYFWNNIVADRAFYEDANGDVFFSNGAKLFKFNTASYNDDGVAINQTYATTWHNVGEPSLLKKFLSLRMFALTNDAFTVNITTQGDWDTSKTLTTNNLVFSSTDQTKFVMLNMQTKRSLRIIFTNNVLNENMALTGYELTVEAYNTVDKN